MIGAGEEISPAVIETIRKASLDSVAGAFAYHGGEDLNKPNLRTRKRTRLTLTDCDGCEHELYMKRYGPERLGERIRRVLTYGPRKSPAVVEFENIVAARQAGVNTMQAITSGQDIALFALSASRSFIIVTSVRGEALERCGEDFLSRHDDDAKTEELTAKLADIVRKFHQSGYVHRDLYAAHVFLDETQNGLTLYLIDLARMFRPRWRKFRWRVKDLAQLKYSMPPQWVQKYWDKFLADYLADASPRDIKRYNDAIDGKVESISRRQQRKQAKS